MPRFTLLQSFFMGFHFNPGHCGHPAEISMLLIA